VLVNGENVGTLKRAALPWLRRNIGMVFQDQKLLFDRNAFANVMLPLAIAGFPPGEAERRVQAALDKVGLLDKARAMPIALSGGEQQRLAIARAVVGRPSLLLADEPTAHLDEDNARDIAKLFYEFQQVGVTVVIATHNEELYAPYAPGRIGLAHGRMEVAA
jgi:cell division transport system ATP-binding protein